MTDAKAEHARCGDRARQLVLCCLIALSGIKPALADTVRVTPVQQTGMVTYITYVTQAGDTLYDIAVRYLRDADSWRPLGRLNQVTAPRRLPAGIHLRIPAALLRQDLLSAHVAAVHGNTEHAFRNGPFTPVVASTTIGEGDRIRTGSDGFVTLELADGSHIGLPPQTLLEVGSLRQTALTGATDRVFNLHHGEVDSEVTHAAKRDDRFQIRSPSAVAGVRGTRFRVDYDADRRATKVEVLDGAVGVDPAHQPPAAPGVALQMASQLLRAQFGNVTRDDQPSGEPVELLPAPTLRDPAKLQDGNDIVFNLEPQAGAHGWRVQIARDADFLERIRDARTNGTQARFDDLPDGSYFVGVSAFDDAGLEGDTRIYGFERRRFDLNASALARAGTRDYEFRWYASAQGGETRFRFVLANHPDLHDPLIDQTDTAANQLFVKDLPRGVYYWTVIAERFVQGRLYRTSSPVRSFTLAY
ncbi:FecR family protein [Paraburkholderia solisilvae]|nr:FecR domain-containing protein [Paraburkholderia solisilvae]